MAEDPLILREELYNLRKEIILLRANKDALNDTVIKLHEEELKYISEIPEFKKQVIVGQSHLNEMNKLVDEKYEIIKSLNKELNEVADKLVQANKELLDEKTRLGEIKNRCFVEENRISNLRDKVTARNRELNDREKLVINREIFNKNIESDLNIKERDLLSKEKEHQKRVEDLDKNISLHQSNLESHQNKVYLLIEQKQFQIEDDLIIKDKLNKVNSLIKENIDLRNSLLLQAQNLSRETVMCKQKQESLDRNIADLKNQENALKIKELKIAKMVRDNNLEKELLDLKGSLQ